MIVSKANLKTDKAITYLEELHAHFNKRLDVQGTLSSFLVTLPIGVCHLNAKNTNLSADIEAPLEHIDRMEEIFGGWIERLAFRERATLSWHRVTIFRRRT